MRSFIFGMAIIAILFSLGSYLKTHQPINKQKFENNEEEKTDNFLKDGRYSSEKFDMMRLPMSVIIYRKDTKKCLINFMDGGDIPAPIIEVPFYWCAFSHGKFKLPEIKKY